MAQFEAVAPAPESQRIVRGTRWCSARGRSAGMVDRESLEREPVERRQWTERAACGGG